ncbi:MAG: hypothetical protein PHH26_00335 [Candidatus Thermoplasmatota archaeon]|nr:hypothetical protein [Candidatus Thermoplasmatota archaeon]
MKQSPADALNRRLKEIRSAPELHALLEEAGAQKLTVITRRDHKPVYALTFCLDGGVAFKVRNRQRTRQRRSHPGQLHRSLKVIE